MVSVSHLLIHTLEQFRIGHTRDTARGTQSEASTSLGTLSGRLVPASNKEVLVGEREDARVTHALYLSPSSDVRVGDEFVFDGRTFRVTIPKITPSIAIYQKVLMEEVQRAVESSI